MDTVAEVKDLTTKDGTMTVFLFRPADSQRHPAILVIQEAFGVNEHIKDVARRFAAQGYVTAAPDLFYRAGKNRTVSYTDIQSAIQIMGTLTDEGITNDLQVVITELQRHPNVVADRIGITGYCMGGRVSFLAACVLKVLKAAAVYYGGGIVPRPGQPVRGTPPIERAAGISCPVIGFWGAQDQGIPVEHVRQMESTLKGLGKSVEMHIYQDAGHGFFCDQRQSYNQQAAADAWSRTLSFFQEHLQGVPVGRS